MNRTDEFDVRKNVLTILYYVGAFGLAKGALHRRKRGRDSQMV